MKFDFNHILEVFFNNIETVTGLPDSNVNYVGPNDIQNYPYLTWQITDPHDVEQTSLDRQYQIFDVRLNLNVYDTSPVKPFSMTQGIEQLLFNRYFEDQLNNAGCVLANVANNGSPVNDVASANGIYGQNIQVTLRLSSYYRLSYKYYYRILNTNLNKPYQIKH